MRSKICAALIAASFAVPAFAATEMIAKYGDDYVRLMDAPCPYASVLRFINEDQRKHFRKADTRVGGQRYFACFAILGDQVALVYEDGDKGLVPASEFKPDEGV
jgi:hypothetical protein